MRWISALAILLLSTGCGIAEQPESAETVAAFEVPLTSADDRREFLAILSEVADTEGLHVDAATDQELQQTAEAIPLAKQTISATVWRGADDDEPIAVIMDSHDHLGLAWIMFSKGKNPELSTRFRERAMQRIEAGWPETLSLPIMPTGAIPNHYDLVRTPDGYTVSAATRAKFEDEAARIRAMEGS